jgi:hypothetical protein
VSFLLVCFLKISDQIKIKKGMEHLLKKRKNVHSLMPILDTPFMGIDAGEHTHAAFIQSRMSKGIDEKGIIDHTLLHKYILFLTKC